MIAICPNPYRDLGCETALRAARLLAEAGFESVFCPVYGGDDSAVPADLQTGVLAEEAERCRLAVVIGGDGTILEAVRELRGAKLPILGVNLGTKGFMTVLEASQLPLIVNAARGEYAISRRMMLYSELIRGGETVYSGCALNDAVIHGYGECVKITAWCNGERMTGFTGDGVILSTPTGSTGYSMSAGGPIVEPDAENLILSPICAHVMGARSFVLDPERVVVVKTELQHGRRAYLSLDGASGVDLQSGDELVARRADHATLMVDMGTKSFYELAFEKLT